MSGSGLAADGEGEPRRHRRIVEWTMMGLALVMIPIVVVQEASTDVSVIVWAERLSAGIWAGFVLEYVYLLSLSDDKRRFVRAHWFDLLIIVMTPPVVWLPEQLEAFRALRAIRVIRILAVVGRANHTLRRFLRRDSLPYVIALSLFVVLVGGMTIHGLEPETAETVGDGVWWAAATLSTVGYGDIAPTTLAGRLLAVVIMVVGVGTFAALTATIASLFVQAESVDVAGEVRALRSELAAIHRKVDSAIALATTAAVPTDASQREAPPPLESSGSGVGAPQQFRK